MFPVLRAANRPENDRPMQGEQHLDLLDTLSASPRFLRGVFRHVRAVRLVRQLAAENTELKAINQRLLYENTHDDLTGTLNKKAWQVKVGERVEASEPIGVIFMDMDAFKAINDNIGHDKGDEILAEFGEYMRSSFRRQGEIVSHERYFRQADDDELPLGRYGGDEFGIIVNLNDRGHADGLSLEQRMSAAEDYTERVTQDFVKQQDQKVRALHFNISLGGAIWYPDNPVSANELINQADQAMYQAKVANVRSAR